jgi:hypothetical protein
MRTLAFLCSALTIGVAALLAACNGATQPASGAFGAIPPAAVPAAQAANPATSSGDLLYVDDSGTDYSRAYVDVFTYPQGKLVTTLTGFHRLSGECSDSNGDVFIVAPGEELSNPTTIYEYAHGGSTPIATLTESGEGNGCAVDPATGNLAVANTTDQNNPYKSGYGSVAVFAGAQGSPTMFYSSTLDSFWYCGYDNQGNLYLSVGETGGYGLASLDAGSGSSIEPVNLNAKLYGAMDFEPSVQWDGKEMTVSSTLKQLDFGKDSGPVKVYRLSISGQNATVTGTTKLDDTQERHRGQSWIQGSTIVGIDYYKGRPQVTFWNYPSGGNPAREITRSQNPAASILYGVTVSVP